MRLLDSLMSHTDVTPVLPWHRDVSPRRDLVEQHQHAPGFDEMALEDVFQIIASGGALEVAAVVQSSVANLEGGT